MNAGNFLSQKPEHNCDTLEHISAQMHLYRPTHTLPDRLMWALVMLTAQAFKAGQSCTWCFLCESFGKCEESRRTVPATCHRTAVDDSAGNKKWKRVYILTCHHYKGKSLCGIKEHINAYGHLNPPEPPATVHYLVLLISICDPAFARVLGRASVLLQSNNKAHELDMRLTQRCNRSVGWCATSLPSNCAETLMWRQRWMDWLKGKRERTGNAHWTRGRGGSCTPRTRLLLTTDQATPLELIDFTSLLYPW